MAAYKFENNVGVYRVILIKYVFFGLIPVRKVVCETNDFNEARDCWDAVMKHKTYDE